MLPPSIVLVRTSKDGEEKLAVSVYSLFFQKSSENSQEVYSESNITVFVIVYMALFLACKTDFNSVLYSV